MLGARSGTMVTFAGVSHVALTVTDLEASQRFYTEVLDFVVVMDVGYGRICMHPRTGFTLGLLRHEGAHGGAFTELSTGLDHLGLVASSRDELKAHLPPGPKLYRAPDWCGVGEEQR